MSQKRWAMTEEDVTLEGDALRSGCRVTKRTLHGGLRDGVELIEVDNGAFRFAVIPQRGMGVWKGWLGDDEIGWQSPIRGPVHPKFVPLTEPSGLGWLDGFDELLVRCGLESDGAPEFDAEGRLAYPLHGRIANKPAQQVDVYVDESTGEISVTGVVEETRFHFQKLRLTSTITTAPGELGFRIHDVVENLSASSAGTQMIYHTNFGEPLLDPGSRLVAPLVKVVPRNEHAAGGLNDWKTYGPHEAGCEEQVYFTQLASGEDGWTQTLLKNAAGSRGVSLHCDTTTLPCFSVWKNTTASEDGYVTGLEPGTNFPNPRSFEGEQGRVVQLPPQGKVTYDLRIELHADAKSVRQAEAAVAALASGVKAIVEGGPTADWCA